MVGPRDGERDGFVDGAALGIAVAGEVVGMVDGDGDAGERVGGSDGIAIERRTSVAAVHTWVVRISMKSTNLSKVSIRKVCRPKMSTNKFTRRVRAWLCNLE